MDNANIGTYIAYKKDGTKYYRASITFKNKHISLGSYHDINSANSAYKEAKEILYDHTYTIDNYDANHILPFKKYIIIINYRDNNIYFSAPIYIRKKFFFYYLTPEIRLTFDRDDLFYYSNKSILKRGNHIFVTDYGMQLNILNRYSIHSHSLLGRDYEFINNDHYDYRYENIRIINKFVGVQKINRGNKTIYKTCILAPYNRVVGYYKSEIEAAIAYNKAADTLIKNGIRKNYTINFIDEISNKDYAHIYSEINIFETCNKK